MKKMMTRVRRIVRQEEGASLVEYGMLVGLIACACIIAVTALGGSISTMFNAVSTAIAAIPIPA